MQTPSGQRTPRSTSAIWSRCQANIPCPQLEPKLKEAGIPYDVIPMQWYGMVRGDLVMQKALDMIAEAQAK